jgi:solute carrier family 25 phosphate transporter 23/24/25/41
MQEFRSFVKQTEQELWSLFERIDRNHDGKLDRDELQAAVKTAGVNVSSTKLQRFFDEVDANHDGTVTFEEWRCVSSSQPAHVTPKNNFFGKHNLSLAPAFIL